MLSGGRLNYTHEDYLNLFIIYGECNKVLSRTCDVLANSYPEKQKPSLNSVKRVIKNFKNFDKLKKKPIHGQLIVKLNLNSVAKPLYKNNKLAIFRKLNILGIDNSIRTYLNF